MISTPVQGNMYTVLLSNHSLKEFIPDIKYRVLLVAYRNLSEPEEKELQKYFISNINREDSINEEGDGIERSCVNMTYRVGLYHNWFSDKISEKLKEGYKIGIVEIPKSYNKMWELRLKELKEKYNIIVIDTAEI